MTSTTTTVSTTTTTYTTNMGDTTSSKTRTTTTATTTTATSVTSTATTTLLCDVVTTGEEQVTCSAFPSRRQQHTLSFAKNSPILLGLSARQHAIHPARRQWAPSSIVLVRFSASSHFVPVLIRALWMILLLHPFLQRSQVEICGHQLAASR